MNQVIKVLAVVFIFHFPFSILHSQVGVIDSKKIFTSMPVFAKMDTMVAMEQMKYQKEYNDKNVIFQEAYKVADSFFKKNPKGPVTKTLIENAQRLENDLKEYEKQATAKLQEYKAKLYQPHYDKINGVVKSLAIKKGIKQVMDVQANSFVYIDITTDITDEVIKSIN